VQPSSLLAPSLVIAKLRPAPCADSLSFVSAFSLIFHFFHTHFHVTESMEYSRHFVALKWRGMMRLIHHGTQLSCSPKLP
jgi:hypothetical protein